MKDCKDNEDLIIHKMNWNNVFMNCIASSCPVFLRRGDSGAVLAGAGTCARHARCQHYAPRATQHRERGAELLLRGGGAQFSSLGRGEQWHWPVVTVTSSVPGASQVSTALASSNVHVVTWRHVMLRHPASNKFVLDNSIWKEEVPFFLHQF